MQKMKVNSYLTSQTKINSKKIKGLTITPNTTKLSEENTGINLHDLKFLNNFLSYDKKKRKQQKADN